MNEHNFIAVQVFNDPPWPDVVLTTIVDDDPIAVTSYRMDDLNAFIDVLVRSRKKLRRFLSEASQTKT